ncbi:Serine/threonine protein kinase, partial [Coemansia sp. S142-1]
MDCDLNELVVSRNGRRLPETVILDITYQVLNGLDFIHRNDLFHRDIKPENVLIRRHVTGSGPSPSAIVVEAKIADFGLVHDMDFSRPLTDYISTRWYRAPEVLLNCANYSTPIDVWAVGTIVSELATLRPLFPGTNQIDQLRRIFEVLGTPRISTGADEQSPVEGAMDGGSWYEGAVHARKLGIAFVPSTRRPVASVMPDVSAALTQLVDYLLVLNPANRPTARDALVVVSRMLDHTLGEAQEYEAVDPPNHQLPDEDERRVPVVEPPVAAVAAVPAKRLLRIPPIMGKTRSTGTIDTTSSVAPATPVSATPPVVPVVSRPSVEINIVHELHREPMRDPRADLSDLAVTGFKGPQNRVRSRSVSSVSSLGSTTPRSMAVSPDNSMIFGSSGIASTSSTDLPVVPPGLPGQQVSMRSAIGKTSLLSA